jgi:hypothetical protein
MNGHAYREIIASLTVENFMLRRALQIHIGLEQNVAGRLYEAMAAAAGLPPADRRIEPDAVERVLTEIYRGHDG